MLIDDNRKRADFFPRKDIPDAWASKGRCPLCSNVTLQVIHSAGEADYFFCPPCELSFEVEMNTGIIRLKNIPEKLGFLEDVLRYNWVNPAVLHKLVENRSSFIQQKAGVICTQTLSDEVVWHRTLGLYRLGNQPKMIEFTLMQSGATLEQVETATLKLRQWCELDKKRQGQKLWFVGVVTILFIFSLFAAGWIFTSSQINSQLSQGRANPAVASQPNMPLQVLNALPDGIKPEFLKAPPARVEEVGPERARCPGNSATAAQLFGGDVGDWQPASQPDSWQMISTGKPSIIRIPRGMVAGFIDNHTFVFKSADGPAKIYNVNFIAISCQ